MANFVLKNDLVTYNLFLLQKNNIDLIKSRCNVNIQVSIVFLYFLLFFKVQNLIFDFSPSPS